MTMNKQEQPGRRQSALRVYLLAAFALTMLLGLPAGVSAQNEWTTNGNNINNTNTGNVGVGTTGPDRKLDILDSANPQLRLSYTDGSVYTDFHTASTGQLLISPVGIAADISATKPFTAAADSDAFRFYTNADSNLRWAIGTNTSGLFSIVQKGNNWSGQGTRFAIDRSGNIGIGTTAPNFQLDVNRGTTSSDVVLGIDANNSSTYSPTLYFRNLGTAISKIMSARDIQFQTSSGGGLLYLKTNGSVGIGTTAPGYKLDVQGGSVNSSGGLCIAGDCKTSWAQVGGGGSLTGVTAGSGLTGGGTSGTVTLTNADPGSSQSIFKNIANAAGTTQFSAGSNNDTLRIEGTGGTSVSFNAATKKVTINSATPASTISATNVSAGQFGLNTGNGNYSFPGNLNVTGTITAGTIEAKYQDVAEWVPATHALPAGTVVTLNPAQSNQVTASSTAYDTRVAGVVSERPGLALGEAGKDKVLVATTGRVKVKVDATRSPINIGDLLVTSDKEGVAMKSEPVELGGIKLHRPGTLIGKALEPLEKGTGEILVLLSLQ